MPNVVKLFQPCSVKHEPVVKSLPADLNGLFWNRNETLNEDYYWHVYENQMLLDASERYKYYGFEHDLSSLTTTHYLILT